MSLSAHLGQPKLSPNIAKGPLEGAKLCLARTAALSLCSSTTVVTLILLLILILWDVPLQ